MNKIEPTTLQKIKDRIWLFENKMFGCFPIKISNIRIRKSFILADISTWEYDGETKTKYYNCKYPKSFSEV